MRRQSGFTLIELVVVITILGILAAFAIPRFTNIESQARIATMNGLAGSLRSAAALAHAQWLAEGATTGTTQISVEGAVVEIVNGYPSATANGIDQMVLDSENFGSAGSYNAPNRTSCTVTYTIGPNGIPIINSSLSVSDC